MKHNCTTIDQSYRLCHMMAKQAGSSFYPCFIVLPEPQRRAMEALYVFMRHTDDLGDRPDVSAEERLAELHTWRDALDLALNTSALEASPTANCPPPATRYLPALADAVHRFEIPSEHLHAVIDGVEMDVRGESYETFDQLAEYCHRVASAVGLACIHIWGFRGTEVNEPARACGLAFQLTNILRDLKEDVDLGRVYLPAEDMQQCGYTVDALQRGETSEPFQRLMQMEIGRAEQFYREGAQLFDYLERPGQRILGMMFGVYHRLLHEIACDPAAVFSRRVRVGRMTKWRLAARWLLLPPSRRALL